MSTAIWLNGFLDANRDGVVMQMMIKNLISKMEKFFHLELVNANLVVRASFVHKVSLA